MEARMDWPTHRNLAPALIALGVLLLCLQPCLAQTPNNSLAEGTTLPATDTPSRAPTAAPVNLDRYVIGPNDVLAIDVWKETELTRVLPVRPDGQISLPLIGDVQASGLTPHELQASLTEKLRAFFEHPAVTVIVQQANSHHFNVMGEVQKPGAYAMTEPVTVLDALALAGGFRDFAKEKKIYVLRGHPDGSHERLPFNYREVIKGKNMAQNIQLRPGDTIVVP
jgi:polysaccharide biosynthesis/export protein